MAKPRWRWDEGAKRFRASSGRFLPSSAVRTAVDSALQRAQARVTTLAEQLRTRQITLGEWEAQMRGEMKAIHIYSGLAAKGGRSQLSPAENGRIGRRLRDQYERLRNFADQIENGSQPLDGRFMRRAGMYAQAGRATYEITKARDLRAAGFTEIRSILHPADHCVECVAEAAKAWQPPETFTPIGERQCLTNCRCTAQYRNPATGEIAA